MGRNKPGVFVAPETRRKKKVSNQEKQGLFGGIIMIVLASILIYLLCLYAAKTNDEKIPLVFEPAIAGVSTITEDTPKNKNVDLDSHTIEIYIWEFGKKGENNRYLLAASMLQPLSRCGKICDSETQPGKKYQVLEWDNVPLRIVLFGSSEEEIVQYLKDSVTLIEKTIGGK